MTRRGKRIAGAIMVAALAPILLLTAGSLLGGLVIAICLILYAWGMSRPAGRMVTGSRCVVCKQLVTLEYEADICAECGAGLHARCRGEHTRAIHGAPPA